MGKIKKVVSLILAMMMTMAMSLTAFAAEAGTITVTNPMEGQEYTAYKIFDVVYNDTKDAYAYSIQDTSEWFADIQGYGKITLEQVNGGHQYVVTKNADFTAADFANFLKERTRGKSGVALVKNGNVAKAEGLDLGYYFVSSTSGALCNLTTTDPTAVIRDKNDVPFEKKDNKDTVEIGEEVNYTITGKIPDTTGFEEYEYLIEDKMTEGLSFDFSSVKVVVGGERLAEEKFNLTETDNGFKLKIYVKDLQDKVGEEIKITYNATVNEKAVSVISKNEAKLTYSNDPADSKKTTTTPPVEETVYTAKVKVNKFEKDNEGKKLAGAKFVLKNAEEKFYKYDETEQKVTWVDDQKDAKEVITNDAGEAEFKGLKDGDYKLVETEAPEGYNMLTAPVDVKIEGGKATVDNLGALTATADVANSTGSTLPETGGMGTKIFYALGGIMVLGAAIVMVVRRRMNASR